MIENWRWKGGELISGERRLTIRQAFSLQSNDEDIAMACIDVLKPNTSCTRNKISGIIRELKEE